MNPISHFIGTLFSKQNADTSMPKTSLFDININRLNGQTLELSLFKRHYILFVNVASKCGFTHQYKDLQALQDSYKDSLVVIGVPCNQFGSQEPGNSKDIASFCDINYGVTFPITEKVKVKGHEQHALYQWLTQKKYNGVKNSSVKWNFQKYLVAPNGELLDYFYSTTPPLSSKITKHLKQKNNVRTI